MELQVHLNCQITVISMTWYIQGKMSAVYSSVKFTEKGGAAQFGQCWWSIKGNNKNWKSER